MQKKKIFFVIALLISLITQSNAQVVFGKYAGEFMYIGVGGRPLGMGGAFTAIANDATAGYYNPAGLAHLNYPQISLMHDERYGNLVNYNYANVSIPYKEDLSFGLSVMRIGVDGIPDTRNALIDRNTGQVIYDISLPSARIDPSKVKEFSYQDWAFYFTVAKRYESNFYMGANIKVIRKDVAEAGATGFGFDLGAWYSPMDNLYLGANVQDITTTMIAWSTGRKELVTPTAKIGAAYSFYVLGGTLLPAIDFDIRFENRRFASQFNLGPISFDPHLGIEFNFKNLIAIRAGYNDVKQITLGAGLKLPKLNIDYSFARFNMSEEDRLPDTHRISLILTLEEPRFLRIGS